MPRALGSLRRALNQKMFQQLSAGSAQCSVAAELPGSQAAAWSFALHYPHALPETLGVPGGSAAMHSGISSHSSAAAAARSGSAHSGCGCGCFACSAKRSRHMLTASVHLMEAPRGCGCAPCRAKAARLRPCDTPAAERLAHSMSSAFQALQARKLSTQGGDSAKTTRCGSPLAPGHLCSREFSTVESHQEEVRSQAWSFRLDPHKPSLHLRAPTDMPVTGNPDTGVRNP